MNRNQSSKAAIVMAVALLAGGAAPATETYPVTVQKNVEVRMRDGVTLRSDIYRPEAGGDFPVLLQRTPYDKNNVVQFGMSAAASGYVVVVQDVRGRYASDGEWNPFRTESNDGFDTVEWAAALPHSSGKVGMFGGSYVGATQLLAAIARPPHLAGICPVVTGSNYHENWTYQGGAFEQWFNESWIANSLASNTFNRNIADLSNAMRAARSLPLQDFSITNQTTASLAPYFQDWLAHPDYDDYWKSVSVEDHYADIGVPALHIAAWYDLFLGGSLRNYVGIKAHGASDEARRGQRLMVIVGGHAGNGPKVGAVDFGERANFDIDAITLRWYDYLFKGIQNEFVSRKPVGIFVMGANQWREEEDWPLPQARSARYYLHSAGGLGTAPPAAEGADTYVYDPEDPVPTIGGSLCCIPLATGVGPQDQRPAETRHDVLVYLTPALKQDMEVTGPVSLDLYVSSSAVDTDFTGMLVDVWPNGFAQNLTSGILRLRYRSSQGSPRLAKPGEIYHINVDLWATSNVFRAGHRLQLEVSSSNYPRFDRNLNTGELQATGTRMIKATNVVYHDKRHPSALVLQVVGPASNAK